MSDHEMKKSLISAYCDGELNAVELAQVETLLATSETARAELRAYRQMSTLVNNARPQIQANLTSSVMQAIRSQSSATATPRSRSNTVVASSQASRDSAGRTYAGHRSWALVAASVVAVAVVFWVGVRRGGNDELAQNKDQQKSGSEVASNSQTGLVEAGEPDATKSEQSIARTDVNPDAKTVATTNTVSPPFDASQLPVELIDDLKNSNVGQIQKFIRQNKDGVTVFHLMVVDITPGMESLEMILSAQKISTIDGKPTNDRADVVAVYVEAEQGKMEGLVEEIKKEHEKFLALAVQRDAMPNEQMASLTPKKSSATSQAVPVDAQQLKNVGVSPLKTEQIELARNQSGRRGSREGARGMALKPPGSKLLNESPMLKLLIVVEKATPASLLNQPMLQKN